MLPNSGKPSRAPLLTRLLGGVISFERQAHEQLRPGQFGPPVGGRIQRKGEVVGFGHKMTRTGSRHSRSVTPICVVLHPRMASSVLRWLSGNCRPGNASKAVRRLFANTGVSRVVMPGESTPGTSTGRLTLNGGSTRPQPLS